MPTDIVTNPGTARFNQSGQSASDNPLDKEKTKEVPVSLYSEEAREYLGFLQKRLESAKIQKDNPWPEFNNKTYYQRYEDNLKIANTHHLDAKKNEDDVIVSAGTIEAKLDSLLSHINGLNLDGELDVFDRNQMRLVAFARGLEDIVRHTEINEPYSDDSGDEEKKMARQREMFIQGEVFVMEEWLRLWERKKVLKGDKWSGKFKGVEWTTKLEKVFEGPSRTMLYGPNVYLGDMTQFYMDPQPYIFTCVPIHYDVAKAKYGHFDNWDYVQKGKVPGEVDNSQRTIFDNKWRLTELTKDQVEVLFYEDQTRDEFQIIINGVMMLPLGFPLSAVSSGGKYNIIKQVFRPIHDKWAYGKGFVSSGSVQEVSKLIDEMLKLFVLKTRKSIMPPYANISGRVISKKVLSPGRISMGIDPQSLQAIGQEGQGVTAGEQNFLSLLSGIIDKSTVSEQFTGQRGKTGQTATEVITLQRQAQLTLGLSIAACMLLEKKLKYPRLFNIIDNWFEPIGEKVEMINGVRKLIKEYRSITQEVNIDGEGLGERSVVVTDQELPTPSQIRQIEKSETRRIGKPVRKIFINPTQIRDAKMIFYWRINPKEKESSPLFKFMFREKLNDMIALMRLGSRPNIDGLEEELARIWGVSRNKLFQPHSPGGQGPNMPEGGGAEDLQSVEQISNALGQPAGAGSAVGGAEGSLTENV